MSHNHYKRSKNMKIKLFIDLDGTLAEWRAAANYEDLFTENYFSSLGTHEAVKEAVEILWKHGVEIYVLSAYLTESKFALREKNQWVTQHVPFIDAGHRLFVPQEISKPEYVAALVGNLTHGYVLLDDYSRNLHEWKAAGGTGIKLLNGVNGTKGTWLGAAVSRFCCAGELADSILAVAMNT